MTAGVDHRITYTGYSWRGPAQDLRNPDSRQPRPPAGNDPRAWPDELERFWTDSWRDATTWLGGNIRALAETVGLKPGSAEWRHLERRYATLHADIGDGRDVLLHYESGGHAVVIGMVLTYKPPT